MIRTSFPEPTPWNGDDDRPMPSAEDERIERDWADLEATARDFVKEYGASAMLRCVSYALEPKR